MEIRRIRGLVRGRVQGVGFRYFVLRRARSSGLAGFVRNRPDGAVELEAEGVEEALESFKDEIAAGPPSARVESAVWEEKDIEGDRDFIVKF